MSGHCQSCTAPMNSPEFKSISDIYCKYCLDDNGNLKSKDEIQQGIVMWFKGWHETQDDAVLQARAEHFMKSMPAWAGIC